MINRPTSLRGVGLFYVYNLWVQTVGVLWRPPNSHGVVSMAKRKSPRNARFSEEEDAIILAHYGKSGAAGCLPLLKNRSRGAVNKRAGRLGLTGPDVHLDEAAVARIAAWIALDPAERSTITALADELGVTPSAVSQRAKAMGYQPRPYTHRKKRKKTRRGGKRNRQGRS